MTEREREGGGHSERKNVMGEKEGREEKMARVRKRDDQQEEESDRGKMGMLIMRQSKSNILYSKGHV